jgi:protein-disulfide isomerase
MGKNRVEPRPGRRANVVKRSRSPRSLRPFYIALGLLVVAGGAVLGTQLTKSKPAPRIVDPAVVAATKAQGYLYGNPDAPVTIVEFADFECPACANFATITEPDVRKRILDAGLANLRYFDFPLAQHQFSMQASTAAACANDQGKFWQMHDRLYEGQTEWSPQFARVRNPRGIFERYAREIGLDVAKWGACYEDGRHQARIEANRDEGIRRGVGSTPTFQIGRRLIPGALPYDQIKAYVDSAAAEARRAASAAATPGGRADTAAGGGRGAAGGARAGGARP